MTVAELIKVLKGYSQDLPVVYACCSEYAVLEFEDISVEELCDPREDDWVARARPDKPTRKYLTFPGN
jgi:hypothetical protein